MQKEIITFGLPSLFLNIETRQFDPDKTYRDLHFHNAIEVVLVHSGSLVCHTEDAVIPLGEGDTLLINRGVIHRLTPVSPSLATYIQIDISKYLKQLIDTGNRHLDIFLASQNTKPYLTLSGESELFYIANAILKEALEKKDCYALYVKTYLFHLTAFMCRYGLLSTKSIPHDNEKLREIMPVISYIDTHYDKSLSLSALSALTHADKYQLCRNFKAATGTTVIEYINYIRLYHAAKLLTRTKTTIGEISLACGFSSMQYFNRVFKAHHGCTPNTYRKMFSA